jgi:hypothetical protein
MESGGGGCRRRAETAAVLRRGVVVGMERISGNARM